MRIARFTSTVGLALLCVAATDEREVARLQCITLESAIVKYHGKAGHYPTQREGLAALTANKNGGAIVTSVPYDPWGHAYAYNPSTLPMVRSLGVDGVANTADDITAETAGESAGCF